MGFLGVKILWMGVSVENKATTSRISSLRKTDAKIKFLSCEPLLEAIPKIKLSGIDWVIVGGESGPNPREMKEEWVLDIKKQCQETNTAFFFKQWGGKKQEKKMDDLYLGKHTIRCQKSLLQNSDDDTNAR